MRSSFAKLMLAMVLATPWLAGCEILAPDIYTDTSSNPGLYGQQKDPNAVSQTVVDRMLPSEAKDSFAGYSSRGCGS
jgi:hypothetical protein